MTKFLFFRSFFRSFSAGAPKGPNDPGRQTALSKVKHIIAIASCKGGVGKSSVTVNLAYMMQKKFKQKVGILDLDIYGPSLPFMIKDPSDSSETDLDSENQNNDSDSDSQSDSKSFSIQSDSQSNGILPIIVNGVKMMSLGFIRPNDYAAIRGPMATGVVQQMMNHTNWGELDYLFLDCPPGTGDIQLTIAQMGGNNNINQTNSKTQTQQGPNGKNPGLQLTNLSGGKVDAAIVVTTPQKLSLVDVEKGIRMFDSVKIPTIALVENMSVFYCPYCKKESSIYHVNDQKNSSSPAKQMANDFGIEVFHALPIDPRLATPKKVFTLNPNHENTSAYNAFHSLASDIYMMGQSGKLSSAANYGSTASLQLQFDPQTLLFNLVKLIDPSVPPSADNVDSVLGSMSSRELRMSCRSARMYDEFTGEKIFSEKDIAKDVRPKNIQRAGSYAVQVDWNDGHTSLYPFTRLEEIMKLKEQ